MLKEHWLEIYLLGAFIFMAWNPWRVNDGFIPVILSLLWPITAPFELWLWAFYCYRTEFYLVLAGIAGLAIIFFAGSYLLTKEQQKRETIIIQQTLKEVKRQCDGPLPLRINGESYSCRRVAK